MAARRKFSPLLFHESLVLPVHKIEPPTCAVVVLYPLSSIVMLSCLCVHMMTRTEKKKQNNRKIEVMCLVFIHFMMFSVVANTSSLKKNKQKGALEFSSGCIYLQNYAQEHAQK